MNKIISIILLCTLLLTCLTSCSFVDGFFDKEDNESGNTPPENPDATLPENPDEVEEKTPTVLQATDYVVVALIEYLRQQYEELHPFDIAPITMADKIDWIKNGARAMLLNYQSSKPYFVCAYYEDEDVRPLHEYADKFTWVKFENANEITEKYNDTPLVVAYQFNKASLVSDIITKDADVPNVEYFKYYKPSFNDGVNINDAIVFDKMFIHLDSSKKDNVYYTTTKTNYSDLDFIYLDGQYYITVPQYAISYEGDRHDYDLNYYFEGYYDALMSVMISNKHSTTNSYGNVYYYGLIKFEDFASIIN